MPNETLDAELQRIRAAQSAEEAGWYDEGAAIGRIRAGKLFAGRYPTLAACIHHEFPESASQLFAFARIAEAFSRDVAMRYHVSALDLLETYAHLTRADLPADPGPFLVSVPKGKTLEHKRFADCTAEDLRAAIAHARGHEAGGGSGEIPKEDQKAVRDMDTTFIDAREDGVAQMLARFDGKVTRITFKDMQLPLVPDICGVIAELPAQPSARKPPRKKRPAKRPRTGEKR